jgi:HSP20 family protein
MSDIVKKESESELATAERTRGGAVYVPRFDIVETEEELVLYGDMPGVAPENLDVRFENEHLIVLGKVEPRHEHREYVYGEYGIGDYHREFRVSEAIDAEKISADLANGVLTVHLPKAERVKPKRIEVKAGS